MTMKGIGLALCLYVSACAMVEHLPLFLPLMVVGIIMLSSRNHEGDTLAATHCHNCHSQTALGNLLTHCTSGMSSMSMSKSFPTPWPWEPASITGARGH